MCGNQNLSPAQKKKKVDLLVLFHRRSTKKETSDWRDDFAHNGEGAIGLTSIFVTEAPKHGASQSAEQWNAVFIVSVMFICLLERPFSDSFTQTKDIASTFSLDFSGHSSILDWSQTTGWDGSAPNRCIHKFFFFLRSFQS
jgi:hypothetical protein